MVLVMTSASYQLSSAAPAKTSTTQATSAKSATRVTAQPTMARDFTPAAALPAERMQQMRDKLDAMHDAMNTRTRPAKGAAHPVAAPKAAASTASAASDPRPLAPNPSDLVIGRNNQNTVANTNTCGTASTLNEPAAANEGPNVYATGNLRQQEFSTNGGSTWACAAAYPAGPAAAPTPFGDTDVIYDHARGVTFHSVIYVNSALTDGVLGIFVRPSITSADACTYFIDFDPSANVLPDYPHLGLSNDFLYFSANRVGSTWLGATIERLNADQLAACGSAGGNIITFTNAGGQRILVPGHGARDVMYMAWIDTTSQWRVFSWADGSTTVLSTFVGVGTMTFGTTDCRGGTNNANWQPNTSIVGFPVRATVGNGFVHAWAPVSNDAGHTHAYLQGAQFRIGATQDALTLVQQPQIFFGNQCAGSPNFGVNDRGDLGFSIAVGGANGGGGPAVGPCVGMKDEFNPGPGGFFCLTVSGANQNPTRYGDYFTVRRQAPCGEYFAATGYGFVNGTALANVDSRYVEFGRGRDNQCYLAWRNSVPAT
jgi:hypothetical protein